MKKILLSALIIVSVLAVGGYIFYRTVVPQLIAEAVVSESVPAYIPKRLQPKVNSMRAPLNKGTEAMLKTMEESSIPLERVLEAVDNVTEDDAYQFLDELNKTRPSNTDQVFDLAKKHFPAGFDVEVFREPFNRHFEMKQIRNAVSYANFNRKTNDIDIATAKAIVKQILIEKQKEINGGKSARSDH